MRAVKCVVTLSLPVIIRQSWPSSQYKGYKIFWQGPNHQMWYEKASTIKEAATACRINSTCPSVVNE